MSMVYLLAMMNIEFHTEGVPASPEYLAFNNAS